MLTGKRFLLRIPSIAIDFTGGAPRRVTVPHGATLKVVNDPQEQGKLLDALWDGRLVYVSREEIEMHGEEMEEERGPREGSSRCSTCDRLLSWYESSVSSYNKSVKALNGALGDDFMTAFSKAEALRKQCLDAGRDMMSHWRSDHGSGFHLSRR